MYTTNTHLQKKIESKTTQHKEGYIVQNWGNNKRKNNHLYFLKAKRITTKTLPKNKIKLKLKIHKLYIYEKIT